MRRLQRLAVLTSAGALVAGGGAAQARAALFFLFARGTAAPNDRVTLLTGGTAAGFSAAQRIGPLTRVRGFPSEGCWRLTARDRDGVLTYVVDVAVR